MLLDALIIEDVRSELLQPKARVLIRVSAARVHSNRHIRKGKARAMLVSPEKDHAFVDDLLCPLRYPQGA